MSSASTARTESSFDRSRFTRPALAGLPCGVGRLGRFRVRSMGSIVSPRASPLSSLSAKAKNRRTPPGVCLPDFVCVTTPNGSKSAAKADLSPLRGRDVTIWRDADAPGLEYARALAALCVAAGAASVAIVAPPGGVKEGWDAADAEAEGWTPARALDLVGAAEPFEKPSAESPKKGKAKKERRIPQRDLFMALIKDCVLWHGPDYEGFITVPVNRSSRKLADTFAGVPPLARRARL